VARVEVRVDVALWAAQVLAAVGFAFHAAQLLLNRRHMRARVPWVDALSDPLLSFIGVAEAAGAVGLILPAVTRVAAWLTPTAALGLVALMLLAMIFHVTRREWPNLALNLVLGALAAFIAWGRLAVVPFA
jgi:putative oxidoreductase